MNHCYRTSKTNRKHALHPSDRDRKDARPAPPFRTRRQGSWRAAAGLDALFEAARGPPRRSAPMPPPPSFGRSPSPSRGRISASFDATKQIGLPSLSFHSPRGGGGRPTIAAGVDQESIGDIISSKLRAGRDVPRPPHDERACASRPRRASLFRRGRASCRHPGRRRARRRCRRDDDDGVGRDLADRVHELPMSSSSSIRESE